MDNASSTLRKMVVDNVTFASVKEPSMAEMPNILPDPVLESAKALLDSLTMSTTNLAKMLKPVPSPVKNGTSGATVNTNTMPNRDPIKQERRSGLKITNHGLNKWRPAVMPRTQNSDMNMRTTIESNQITLTLEPVEPDDSFSFRNVPYYARGRPAAGFNAQNFQQVEDSSALDQSKIFERWHRKHINKILRYANRGSITKPFTYNNNSKLRYGWRPYQPPLLNRTNSNAVGAGQKRKYCDVSNRYYQYLNKPKRARHDAFQIIFRSHVLIDEVAHTVENDDNTIYPRRFVTWPSGKPVMPGYHPHKTGVNYKRKPFLKRKRTWSMYRIPRPKPHPVYRVSQNRYAQPSSLRKMWNKKLSSENRLRWDPATKKFTLAPVYHRPVKPAAKQWFRFASNTAPKNAITNALNMSRASSIVSQMHRKHSTPALKTQYNWHRPVSYKPPQTYKPILSYKAPPACKPSLPHQNVLPPSVHYVLRDLRVILHCSSVPDPSFFNSYRNYASNCVLFQIRRLMTVKLLRQGRYEKRIAEIKQNADSGSTDAPVEIKPVLCNKIVTSSVYISDLTEKALSQWTSDLPKECGVGSDHPLCGKESSLSGDWLHVCKGRIVDKIPFRPSEDNEPVPVKNVFLAWAFDEPPNDTVSTSRIIDAGKPSPTRGAKQRDLQVGEFADRNYLLAEGVKSAASSNPHLSQRLVPLHRHGAISIRRGSRALPKLSFCVRFRCSLCTRDCTCRFDPISNTRSDVWNSAMAGLPSSADSTGKVVDENEVTVNNGAPYNPDVTGTNRNEPVFETPHTDASVTLVSSNTHFLNTNPIRIGLNPAESITGSTSQSQGSALDGPGRSIVNSPNRRSACVLSAVKNDCLFRSDKRLMSELSKHVNAMCLGALINDSNSAASTAFDCDAAKRAASQTAVNDVSAGGHCSAVIGRDSPQSNNRTVELDRTEPTECDSGNNASLKLDSVADSVEGMGNNLLRQKLLCGVTSILQVSDCSEGHPFILGTGLDSVSRGIDTKGGLLCPVNGKSNVNSQTQSDELADREVARESHGINGVNSACESSRHCNGDAAIFEDIPSTCLRSYASSPGDDNRKGSVAAESDTAVASTPLCNNAESTRNGCDETVTIVGKSPVPVAKSRQAAKPARVSLKNNKADTASAEGKIKDSVKTRSSHRLRSRLKRTKRGRYETDYISDFPKAAKKARKIQPTNDYDNGDFWKFYDSCENTVYAQNLLLQYKYVKLFKTKGITAECAPTVVGIWDTTTYDSSNRKRPVVPEDGKLAVLEKYTRQRKMPDLQQTDDQCAFCGRSFEGTDKAGRDEHVSRHGARYKALAVPRLPKKKKMKPIQKAGKPTHLPHSSNESHQEAVETQQNAQDLRLLARPSSLSMGHRKQTARKSFTIKSTLPKNVLIKTLECEMRSPPIPGNGKSGESVSDRIKREQRDADPFQGVGSILNGCSPLAVGGRRTITGLPVTYNHFQRDYL